VSFKHGRKTPLNPSLSTAHPQAFQGVTIVAAVKNAATDPVWQQVYDYLDTQVGESRPALIFSLLPLLFS
jgi:hypothetical protein